MPTRLSIVPDALYFQAPIEQAGVSYVLHFRWGYREQAWYVDLQRQEDLSWVFVRRRVSPGSVTLTFPDGSFLLPVGADPYTQADLGSVLNLWLVSADEVAPSEDTPSDPLAELV